MLQIQDLIEFVEQATPKEARDYALVVTHILNDEQLKQLENYIKVKISFMAPAPQAKTAPPEKQPEDELMDMPDLQLPDED